MAIAANNTVRANASTKPSVAIVGGGLAGLTAALRLAQRGFAVQVYEAKDVLGGNISAEIVNGVSHDVYPHMFCPWYANFWQIFGEICDADVKVARDQHFAPREGVQLLDPHSSHYVELHNATTLKSVIANLNSGVLSKPDMFLLGFSMLDLAATPFQRTGDDLLERLDVNGFIYSRGYSTEKVAQIQNYILMVIWSIQSNVTAAASYQDFIKHSMLFPHESPFCYLLTGSLYDKIIKPFEQKLESKEVGIHRQAKVTSVALPDGTHGKATLTIETTQLATADGARPERVTTQVTPDYVIIAVPGPELGRLAMEGKQDARIVDAVPQLSEVRRFRGEAIPVVDIYFNKKLPGIPKEQVGLKQSNSDLTMLDISQLWTGYPDMEDRTVLVVAASNGYALTSEIDTEQGFQIIRQLHDDYLPVFEPGEFWGDPKSDICWEKSRFRSNEDNRLFVNDVGSWQWRPITAYKSLPNVFFAGDFCQTDVDMATMEAAVQSGVSAAQAVQAQDKLLNGALRGDAIGPAKHDVYSDAVFLAVKLALLPWAYAATAWAAVVDEKPLVASAPVDPVLGAAKSALTQAVQTPKITKAAPANSYSPLTYSLLLPVAFTLDWWKTAYWLARKLAPSEQPGVDDQNSAQGENTVGLVPYAAEVAKALWEYLQTPPAPAATPRPGLATALGAFTTQAARSVQAAYAAVEPLYDPATYSRRWRVKR